MRMRPMQPTWTNGSYGRPRRRSDKTGSCEKLYFLHVLFLSLLWHFICKWDPHPENGAQRRLGAEDFLYVELARRGGGRFPLSLSTYPFGVSGL